MSQSLLNWCRYSCDSLALLVREPSWMRMTQPLEITPGDARVGVQSGHVLLKAAFLQMMVAIYLWQNTLSLMAELILVAELA